MTFIYFRSLNLDVLCDDVTYDCNSVPLVFQQQVDLAGGSRVRTESQTSFGSRRSRLSKRSSGRRTRTVSERSKQSRSRSASAESEKKPMKKEKHVSAGGCPVQCWLLVHHLSSVALTAVRVCDQNVTLQNCV